MVENLKQAAREVFIPKKAQKENKNDVASQKKNTTPEKDKKPQAPETAKAVNKVNGNKPNENKPVENKPVENKPAENNHKQQEKSNAVQNAVPVRPEVNSTPAEQTVNIITKDTKIVGTITTGSKLIVDGEVEGGIESKNVVIVSGSVRGDIKCKSAEINSAKVEGNIAVSDKLQVKSESKINGDLSGCDIEISGHVNGNVNAKQSVKLYSNASVIGNINSSSISIENGAILQGNVVIEKEHKA